MHTLYYDVPAMKRRFWTFFCVLPAALGALAWSPSNSKFSRIEDDLPIIDAHVHTSFTGNRSEDTGMTYSRAGLLEQFRQAHVVGAVSMMSRYGTGYDPELKSKGVIFCVGISTTPDYAEIEAGLKSGKYNCIKIYLGYIHKYAYDEMYQPAYALAEKYDVPMVFHTGDTYDIDGKLKYSDPMTIDEVAVDHRKVKMVIAHVGNPWIQTAAEVAYKNPNVYLDGSAIVIGNLERLSEQEAQEQVVAPLRWVFNYLENPKKLMFGTDWPLTPIAQYLELFKKAIPREHWERVFHDNAIEVFKIDPSKLMKSSGPSANLTDSEQEQQSQGH